MKENPDEQVDLKTDRVQHWLSVGAKASETVAQILAKRGIAARTR